MSRPALSLQSTTTAVTFHTVSSTYASISTTSSGREKPRTIDPYANATIPIQPSADTSPIPRSAALNERSQSFIETQEDRRMIVLQRLRSYSIFNYGPFSFSAGRSQSPNAEAQSVIDESPVVEPSVTSPSFLLAQNLHRRTSSSSVADDKATLDAQLTRIRDAVTGTCTWIYDDEEYKAWITSEKPDDNVLLIIGDLAIGKTVLTKAMCKHLAIEGRTVVPFFCVRDIPNRYSTISILATFAYYLLSFPKKFNEILTDHRCGSTLDFSFNEIWDLFVDLLSHPHSTKFVFVIDALDQCDTVSQRLLQTALRGSKQRIMRKILITSRPDIYPNRIGAAHRVLRIDPPKLTTDIRLFLDHELASRFTADSFSKETVRAIRVELDKDVEGMFLLLEGKLQELETTLDNNPSLRADQALRTVFDKLPGVLQDYYFKILKDRMSFEQGQMAEVRSILCVLLAAQQSSFTQIELQHILTFAKDNPARQSGLGSTFDDIIRHTVAVCGPIVRSHFDQNGGGRLELAHPAVKTFFKQARDRFLQDHVLKFLSQVTILNGHIILAKACLRFLTQTAEVGMAFQTTDMNPFLSYSLRYWHVHVRESGEEIRDYRKLLSEFLNPSCTGYREWSLYVRAARIEPGVTPGWWNRHMPLGAALVTLRLENVITTAKPRLAGPMASVLDEVRIDFDELDDFGSTPLILALQTKQYEIARKLMEVHVSINKQAIGGGTALHAAVLQQQTDLVRTLIKAGAVVDTEAANTRNQISDSPIFAAVSGSTDIFSMLLQKASIYTRRVDLWSILHEAVAQNDHQKVQLVLKERLLPVDCKTNEGITPLMVACRTMDTRTIVDILLKHGASVQRTTEGGTTALYEAARKNRPEIVSLLLDHGADVDLGNGECTPLMAACARGWDDVAERLIDAGANIEARSENGDTPLIIAVKEQRDSIVGLLLLEGAEITKSNRDGYTAILVASAKKQTKILAALFQYSGNKGDASRQSAGSWSCLHAAASEGLIENVKCIVQYRRPQHDIDEVYSKYLWTPLHAALWRGHEDVAHFLVAHGADPKRTSNLGWNGIHMVCYYVKNVQLLEAVLDKSDEPSRSAVTDKGSTALSLAAETGFSAAVELLVTKYLADPLIVNKLGCTPLYYAANVGSPELVDFLLKHEYLANLTSDFGWTALHAASRSCPGHIVKRLAALTNWNNRYAVRLTPLHIALQHENNEAFLALLDAGLPANLLSGWGTSTILEAANSANHDAVDVLLRNYDALSKFDTFNSFNNLPIVGAYRWKDLKLINKLRPTVSTTMRLSTNTLESLVHLAAGISLDEVKWAASKNLRLSARNVHHQTPLAIACENGHEQIVDLLLRRDDAHTQNATTSFLTGWTPLHMAARLRHTKVILAMREALNLDAGQQDCFGLTALDYAYAYPPAFLALTKTYSRLARRYKLPPADPAKQKAIDIFQIHRISDWWLTKTQELSNQFKAADTRLAVYAMIDAFFRLEDLRNAQIAAEIWVGPPSTRLNPKIACQICRKNRQQQVFVCKSCPFRLICDTCRQKSRKANLRGCYKHDFLTLPSDSWFKRDIEHVNREKQTLEQWFQSVMDMYDSERDIQFDSSRLPDYITKNEFEAGRVFEMLDDSHFSKLIEHLLEFPRGIATRNSQGRTISMCILSDDPSDKSCARKLKALTELGAKMLVFDNQKISTIALACQKSFEKTLEFILEQWDPDFDHFGDPFSSNAIQIMIEFNWHTSLKLAIERHFDWAAQGKFRKIRMLSNIQPSVEEIVAILEEQASTESSPSSATIDEPWAIFEEPVLSFEEPNIYHRPDCVHNVMKNTSNHFQLGVGETTIPSLIHMETASYNDDNIIPAVATNSVVPDPTQHTYISDNSAQEIPQSRIRVGSMSSSDSSAPLDIYLAEEASNIPDGLPDPQYNIDEAVAACGLGGLHPNCSVTAIFNPPGRRANEAILTYRDHTRADQVDVRTSLEALQHAAQGLRHAITQAQRSQLCCTSFNIAVRMLKNTISGSPVVKLVSLPFDLVIPFTKELLSISHQKSSLLLKFSLGECVEKYVKSLLQVFGLQYQSSSVSGLLHYCSLALQVLCLGFAFFLQGHRCGSALPILASNVTTFRLLGTEEETVISAKPQAMACINDLLQDDILVFFPASSSDVTTASLSDKAYLVAKAEEVIELWGPALWIPAVSGDDNRPDGILALHIGRGQLTLTGESEDGRKIGHWTRAWRENESLDRFSAQEELLIGALPVNPKPCRFDNHAAWTRALVNEPRLIPLRTRDPSWHITEKFLQVGLNAPYGGGVNVGAVRTPDRGRSMKQIILRDWQWAGVVKDLPNLNQPWGVILSICTGFAHRVPLRLVIAEVFDEFVDNMHVVRGIHITQEELKSLQRELKLKLSGFGHQVGDANRIWSDYLRDLSSDHVQRVSGIICNILEKLEDTGYNKQTQRLRVAWPSKQNIGKGIEFTCSRTNKLRWLRLLEDSSRIATFAVATKACLVAHLDNTKPYGSSSSCRSPEINLNCSHSKFSLLETRMLPKDRSVLPGWNLEENVLYSVAPSQSSTALPCQVYSVNIQMENGLIKPHKFLVLGKAQWIKYPLSGPRSVRLTEDEEAEFVGQLSKRIPITPWREWLEKTDKD